MQGAHGFRLACWGFLIIFLLLPSSSHLGGVAPRETSPDKELLRGSLFTSAEGPADKHLPAVSPSFRQATPLPPDTPPINPGNAARLSPLTTLTYHPWDLVMALAWSPNGEALAVAAGGRIYLYSIPTLEKRAEMFLGAFSYSLAFRPDGNGLAAGSHDGWVRLWSLRALGALQATAPIWSVMAHRKGVNEVAFAPQGAGENWLLASAGNDAVVRIWDGSNEKPLASIVGGSYAVPSLAFLPDGGQIAVINGERLRLRQLPEGRIEGTILAEVRLYSLAVHPAGDWVACGSLENAVFLWQPQLAYRSGQERYPPARALAGHRGRPHSYRAVVWQVAFDPQGALLASVGGDGQLILWDVVRGEVLFAAEAHPFGATSLAFSPDGRFLATGGLDASVTLWGVGNP